MAVYSIKDLEKLSGVKAHTLRIWEKRYGILAPKRTATNVRYYLDGDLMTLLNISLLNKQGIKISKIAEMSPCEIQKKVAEISEIDESFEGQLDALTISLLELDEEKALKIIDKNIEQLGFRETMLEVIYPLLDKLVLMWLSGSVSAVHEKFVTHLIKRKCCSEIDKLRITRKETFLIYLPENEANDLSLLFLHYIIKSFGYRIVDAGANVSLADLEELIEITSPDCIFTIINDGVSREAYLSYLERLCEISRDCDIFLSGLRSITNIPQLDQRVHLLKSSEETVEHLEMRCKRCKE